MFFEKNIELAACCVDRVVELVELVEVENWKEKYLTKSFESDCDRICLKLAA